MYLYKDWSLQPPPASQPAASQQAIQPASQQPASPQSASQPFTVSKPATASRRKPASQQPASQPSANVLYKCEIARTNLGPSIPVVWDRAPREDKSACTAQKFCLHATWFVRIEFGLCEQSLVYRRKNWFVQTDFCLHEWNLVRTNRNWFVQVEVFCVSGIWLVRTNRCVLPCLKQHVFTHVFRTNIIQ